jgi:hypothetical protein
MNTTKSNTLALTFCPEAFVEQAKSSKKHHCSYDQLGQAVSLGG